MRPIKMTASLVSPLVVDTAPPASLDLERGGWQWLPVAAHICERYLVTYRAPAARLAHLLPAPLTVDTRGDQGFVSVCALEIDQMGIAGTPSWMRFSNLEMLYRMGVRVDGRPSFFTLRSDVSAWPLAILGRRFSHYRPHAARLTCQRTGDAFHLICVSGDGRGDGEFLAPATTGPLRAPSVFTDVADATAFLLGMDFSVDVQSGGRVRRQLIEHDPWHARAVRPLRRQFAFLDEVADVIGAPLVYDHTLVMRDLHQIWRAAR